jgi:hypothetical protein
MVPFLARDDLLTGDFDRADGWQMHHVIPLLGAPASPNSSELWMR